MITCTECTALNNPNASRCHDCGASLHLPPATADCCGACATKLPPDSRFCPACGVHVGPTIIVESSHASSVVAGTSVGVAAPVAPVSRRVGAVESMCEYAWRRPLVLALFALVAALLCYGIYENTGDRAVWNKATNAVSDLIRAQAGDAASTMAMCGRSGGDIRKRVRSDGVVYEVRGSVSGSFLRRGTAVWRVNIYSDEDGLRVGEVFF